MLSLLRSKQGCRLVNGGKVVNAEHDTLQQCQQASLSDCSSTLSHAPSIRIRIGLLFLIMIVGCEFSKYVEDKPAGGDALVKSCRSTIYFFPAEEALYAAIDIYLVGAKWMSQWSFENDTDATQTYCHEHRTQLNMTSGAEVAKSVNLSSELKTLAIDVNSWRKTFTDYEMSTTSRTRSLTVNIPPKTKITFYQRKYEFKIAIYFISDSWSKVWKVGTSEDGKRLLTKECTIEITSDDFLAKDAELYSAAVGSMEVKTVSPLGLHRYGGVKNRDLLPERAKQALHRMNL